MKSLLLFLALLATTLKAQELPSLNSPAIGLTQGYYFNQSGHIVSIKSYFGGSERITAYELQGAYFSDRDVDTRGSNYFISDNGSLTTVDAHGYIYPNVDYKFEGRITCKGGNFFMTRRSVRNRDIHIVKNDGIVVKVKKIGDLNLRQVDKCAGNYILMNKGSGKSHLIAISATGELTDLTNDFERLSRHRNRDGDNKYYQADDIEVFGHNYFIMKDGTLFTTGSISTRSTRVISRLMKFDRKFRDVRLSGGNFFFDGRGNLHTIAMNGELNMGEHSRNVKVQDINANVRSDMPIASGSNYFSYNNNDIYMVDSDGRFTYVYTPADRVTGTNR